MRRGAAVFLVLVGLTQMAADVTGLRALKGLAAATGASPAPKVFSAVNGCETFSPRFFIEGKQTDGDAFSLEITPDIYARLRGPYKRRNVYGAVIAYGPVIAHLPMWEAVANYALCGDAPLLRELGLDPATLQGPPRIRIELVAPNETWIKKAPCR